WVNTLSEGAVRTFAALGEQSLETKADYERRFGAADMQVFRAGVLARQTSRDSDTRSYSIYAPVLDDSVRALPIEAILAGNTEPGDAVLAIRSLAQGGSYTADDDLTAGFAMLDMGVGARIRVIGGARVERSNVRVDAVNTVGDPTVGKRVF